RTSKMTDATREQALASIFSARAGGGLTAILQALSNGIRDSKGQIVTGTAAIEEMRRQMASAAGTAGEMKERLLESFEGQKKGLVAATLRRAFVAVNQFIAAIPEPVKSFLAKVVLMVGGVTALVGAVLAAKAG